MELHANNTHTADADIRKGKERLSAYRERLADIRDSRRYDQPESFIVLPDDQRVLDDLSRATGALSTDALVHVVLVGIGGSMLGARALYDALLKDGAGHPRLHCIDAPDATALSALIRMFADIENLREVAVVIASKSGETLETIAGAEIVLAALRERFGHAIYDRTAVISDERSTLTQAGAALGMHTLSIPETVGGRFSVFSAAGLLPLALAGADIEALRAGAASMRESCLLEDGANPAMTAASIQANLFARGYTIHDYFLFDRHLETLGKWHRQLLAESVGKERNRRGTEVHTGITPTVSVGPADLHSVAQLVIGGPRDKMTTFVWAKHERGSVIVPEQRMFADIIPEVSGKSTEDIMTAILEAIKQTYCEQELPFWEIVLDDLGPYALGEVVQFEMMKTAYLAELMEVNAFDQPNVESYKREARENLKRL